MHLSTFLFFLILLPGWASAQKFLQLEKVNSAKTRKYYSGHEITFQLKGGQWYSRTIEDVSYDQKLVIFAKDHVHVDSIIAFRTFDNQRWSRPMGNQLINFAVAWTAFSLIADLASNDPGDDYDRVDAIIAASSTGIGLAIKKLFRKRTFNLKKNKAGNSMRWRLRVLDLDVKPKTEN